MSNSEGSPERLPCSGSEGRRCWSSSSPPGVNLTGMISKYTYDCLLSRYLRTYMYIQNVCRYRSPPNANWPILLKIHCIFTDTQCKVLQILIKMFIFDYLLVSFKFNKQHWSCSSIFSHHHWYSLICSYNKQWTKITHTHHLFLPTYCYVADVWFNEWLVCLLMALVSHCCSFI